MQPSSEFFDLVKELEEQHQQESMRKEQQAGLLAFAIMQGHTITLYDCLKGLLAEEIVNAECELDRMKPRCHIRIAFKNGFGISIVWTPYTYGGQGHFYELALLDASTGKIIYDDDEYQDVVGWCSSDEALEHAIRISKRTK